MRKSVFTEALLVQGVRQVPAGRGIQAEEAGELQLLLSVFYLAGGDEGLARQVKSDELILVRLPDFQIGCGGRFMLLVGGEEPAIGEVRKGQNVSRLLGVFEGLLLVSLNLAGLCQELA